MKAFHVDDETIYAAPSAEDAARQYESDTGAACEAEDYPRELTDAELDASIPEMDEHERLTGESTTLRACLAALGEPGMLACNV